MTQERKCRPAGSSAPGPEISSAPAGLAGAVGFITAGIQVVGISSSPEFLSLQFTVQALLCEAFFRFLKTRGSLCDAWDRLIHHFFPFLPPRAPE